MNTSTMKNFDIAAVVLIIIGGLNWGLIGFFGFNLFGAIFGEMSAISRIIYALVGVSALYRVFQWRPAARRLGGCEPMPKSVT